MRLDVFGKIVPNCGRQQCFLNQQLLTLQCAKKFSSEVIGEIRENFMGVILRTFYQKFLKMEALMKILQLQSRYSKIPDFEILCAGFRCQTFSIAGCRQRLTMKKGSENVFFNIIDMLKVKAPKFLILEM